MCDTRGDRLTRSTSLKFLQAEATVLDIPRGAHTESFGHADRARVGRVNQADHLIEHKTRERGLDRSSGPLAGQPRAPEGSPQCPPDLHRAGQLGYVRWVSSPDPASDLAANPLLG